MNTLAHIRKAIDDDTTMWVGTDSTAPEGAFLAVARIFGVNRTYLLSGAPDQDDAPILGHINEGTLAKPDGSIYVSNGLMGGHLIGRITSEGVRDQALRDIHAKASA